MKFEPLKVLVATGDRRGAKHAMLNLFERDALPDLTIRERSELNTLILSELVKLNLFSFFIDLLEEDSQ